MNFYTTRCPALLPFLFFFLTANPALRSQDVILQGFYWNTHPGDVTNTTTGGIWWDTLTAVAPQLAAAGFKTVWTPPPTKAFAGVWDMGYGTYDYFDLGEINSKGTTRTRHGSRAELNAMITALHTNGINVMADVVLNHRGGADAQAMYQFGGNTGYNVFTPPSTRIPSGPAHVHPNNFHPDNNPDYHNAIFFEDLCYFNENDANPPTNPDGTPGSYFFGAPTLMGSMGDSLIMWGRWLVNDVGYDELRLDAVKHIDPWFVKKFLIESKNGTQPFAIGESFDYGSGNLVNYWSQVQDAANSGGVKNAKISLFDFPLRGSLKSVLNTTNGSVDLYNTLGNAGLVWSTAMGGFDVVTWLESHDTDRQGYINDTEGCSIPFGAACLKLYTENDHDPVVSDKEDMGYPFLMAAEGRPVVFWKDWYWYGMDDDIKWQIALRKATATGASDHIQNMAGFWPTGAPYDSDNNGGNMFALRRDGLTGGVSDGMVLGLNDDDDKEHAVYVNTPFTNKYLKDYSDSYLFQTTQAFGDSRALIKAQKRDYSWWSVTGLYPKPEGTSGSHFNMNATPGGCPHFIGICAADAANLIVNGAPIAAGDEVAVKNAAGQVVGIGRIGQGFKWDGVHDMIIEVLGAPSANGLANGEAFRVFVYDASVGTEYEIGAVQYAAASTVFTFAPDRPNSPNRNGNFATFPVTTTAQGTFTCQGISRIIAFNTQVAVSQAFCAASNASDAAYSDGLQSGDNDGSGFSAWTSLNPASNSGFAGFFVASSTGNGDGDGNGDKDIDTGTAPNNRAWGFYANTNNVSEATRPFTVPLTVGATFSLKMDNGWLDDGSAVGSVGFSLRNSSNQNLMEFYFTEGASSYTINDASTTSSGIGFTDEGLMIEITLLTASTYQLKVTPIGGSTSTFTRTLLNPGGGQTIDRVRCFNFSAGSGAQRNLYFNSFNLCYPATLVINEVDYDQAGTDNMEFIELKNVSSSTVNLDPYTLELVNGGDNLVYRSVNLPNVNLSPGDYFVVCGNGSGVPNCDAVFDGAVSDRVQNGAPDAVRLTLNGSVTVDALSYEGSVSVAVEGSGTGLDDDGTAAAQNLGLSRKPDGNDTNSNNTDFVLACLTPGTANTGNTDTDSDGRPDACDNCLTNANATQIDTDMDGIGNVCDPCSLAVAGIAHFSTMTCNCEPGYYQITETRNGETVIIGCQPCPAGSYCPDGVAAIPCPAGKYSNVTGATACLSCAAGSYNGTPGATECTLCPPGKYSNVTGATECLNCAAGSYNGTSGATECTLCPPGKYSNVTGATECLSCAAGSYNGTSGATECTLCPPGKYSNVTGATECLNCAAGSYNGTSGATECTLCPPGKYINVTGATECLNCAAGSYNGTPGATACTLCPPGKYINVTGATECLNCAAGSYQDQSGQTSCAACPPGQFSNTTGAAACQNCAVNTYSSSSASTECLSCGPGFYSPEGSAACSTCNVTFTATPTPETCAGAMDGQIAITNVMGGTAPFQYSINNGGAYAGTATFTGLASGTYPVRVKDFYNCESAAVNVTVTDNTCPLEFSGTILWEHDGASGVKDATVNLTGPSPGNDLTDVNGDYLISVPLAIGNYTLKPVKNQNKLNGVTALDATAIQQHLANTVPITNSYKKVAADVNKSNSITTTDATIINQSLLGNPSALAQFKTSWRFVPSAFTLVVPPWTFPEQIDLTGVNSNQVNQDFLGIKTGDVVSVYANPANIAGSSIDPFVWRVEEQTLEAAGPVVAAFTTGAFTQLAALQSAFRFDPARLHFDSVEIQTALPLTIDDFGLFNVDSGEIRFVWSSAQGIDLNAGAEAYRLHFTVLEPGGLLSDALALDDDILEGLAYNSSQEEADVELQFFNSTGTTAPGQSNKVFLLQNRPNPFSDRTTAGFILPAAGAAQLRVLDVNGREVVRFNKSYPGGYNEEVLRLDGASGVLYLELTTPWGVVGRKMVAVR